MNGPEHPPEVIGRIRELWVIPTNTTAMVGKLTGFTPEAIAGIVARRRRRDGWADWPQKERCHNAETAEAVKRLWAKAESAAEVAAQLGLTRNQIIGIVFRGRARDGEAEWPTKGSGWQSTNARRARGARKAKEASPALRQHPTPKQPPARPVALPLPTEGLVRWADIKFRGQCKFIWSDHTRDPDLMVCGRPTEGEGSWCPAHRRLCFDARRTAASSRQFRHKALELA